jgi:putative ABC transport system permease protein
MISLAGRDILHAWGKFVFTGIGLGLLIGVTLTMAGVYRGMVDDAKVLLDNSGADLWVVQKDTLGPYAEAVEHLRRRLARHSRHAGRGARGQRHLPHHAGAPGRARRARHGHRASWSPAARQPGWPPYLVAGRQITRGHYEAVADVATGFPLGDRIQIRRNHYTVVGLTRRMVSSGGDPMIFIPLKDAQEAQFLKDNDAICSSAAAPPKTRPSTAGPPGPARCGHRLAEHQPLRQRRAGAARPGHRAEEVAESIRRWKRLTVYTRAQMEEILVGKLIATSAKQIGMFLVILAIVSAAIVAFIIYTLTLGKIREIAVLKLIGTRNRTIAA